MTSDRAVVALSEAGGQGTARGRKLVRPERARNFLLFLKKISIF